MHGRVGLYRQVLEQVLRDHREMVDPSRLRAFLAKAYRKFPLLRELKVTDDGGLVLGPGFSDSDEGLEALSIVLVCTYNALKMFTGDTKARQLVVDSIDRFRAAHQEAVEAAELGPYLPILGAVHGAPAAGRAGPPPPTTGGAVPDLPAAGTAGADEPSPDTGPMEHYYDETAKAWMLRPRTAAPSRLDEVPIEPVFEVGVTAPAAAAGPTPAPAPVAADGTARRSRPGKGAVASADGPERFRFLGLPFAAGSSTLIEGGADALHRLGMAYLAQGLLQGETVVAVLGCPLDRFYLDLLAAGVDMSSCPERVYLIDWYSFKERQIGRKVPEALGTIEDQGNLLSLPGPPEYLIQAFKGILDKIPTTVTARAFVGVLSYGLRFIDYETIFNFAQTARLRLRRQGCPGLFTLEAEAHAPRERSELVGLFPRRVMLYEERLEDDKSLALSGSVWQDGAQQELSWTLPGPSTDDHLGQLLESLGPAGAPGSVRPAAAPAGGEGESAELDQWIARLPTEEEQAVADEPVGTSGVTAAAAAHEGKELAQRTELDQRIGSWAAGGYRVDRLRTAAAGDLRGALAEVATFQRLLQRMGAQIQRLERLEIVGVEERLEEVHRLLPDVYSVAEVERLIDGLEASARALEEDRSRSLALQPFEAELERWRSAGYEIADLLGLLDQPLATVSVHFDLRRQQIFRLQVLTQRATELRPQMSALEWELIEPKLRRPGQVEGLQRDLDSIAARAVPLAVAPPSLAGAGPAGTDRRSELLNELFSWALQGWCVSSLDRLRFFDLPQEELEQQMARLRGKVSRLQQINHEVEMMDLQGVGPEVAYLRRLLTDVGNVDAAEEQWAVIRALAQHHGTLTTPALPGDDLLGFDPSIVSTDELDRLWVAVKARLLPP